MEEKLPLALISDLDRTLALFDHHRGPFDAARCLEDRPNWPVVQTVRYWHEHGIQVIITSGRDDQWRQETEQWLATYEIPYHLLLMRPHGDYRKDVLLKQEMYEQHIAGHYDICCAFDDRNQVVRLWRDLGLTCFQVADGDF